jgi:putative tryptophan/tyrosine transport system substrate-binding protein
MAGLKAEYGRVRGWSMRRRDFIKVIGGTVVWPLAARAQQPIGMRRVGMLMAYAETDMEGQSFVATFSEALAKLGWAEGRSIQIDVRWAPASSNAESRLRFAQDLIALHPDLIVSHGTPNTETLHQQTRTVPVVFVNVSDPIGSGFVASFPRPGGNITGFITMEPTMAGKWVELLKEIAPHVTNCTLLFNPATAPYAHYFVGPFNDAAAALAVKGAIAKVRDAGELETAITTLARERNGGLVVMPDTFMTLHRAKITALANQHTLPTVYPFRFYATSGGLLSYGNDSNDSFRRAAGYADRILKGEKPSELPVQAPAKFELVINTKTATSMGLTIPTSLLVAATEVIE